MRILFTLIILVGWVILVLRSIAVLAIPEQVTVEDSLSVFALGVTLVLLGLTLRTNPGREYRR